MTPQEKIQDILRDLYTLDPEFKKHEQKLARIITQLLANRPEVIVDAAFADTLRKKLAAQATIQEHTIPARKFSWLTSAFAAIALVAVAVSGSMYWKLHSTENNTISGTVALLESKESIRPEADHAFGVLNSTQLGGSKGTGGGGGSSPVQNPATPEAMSAPASANIDGKIAIYKPVKYVFTYKGESIKLSEETTAVLRRQTAKNDTTPLINRMQVGLLNFAKFTNKQVDSIMVSENKEWGYTIYADFKNGELSITQNFETWPLPEKLCRDSACYENLRLQPEQVPADDAVINTANEFLKNYGIATAGYSTPRVTDDQWRIAYSAAADKSQMYIPDTITVVYPLLIDGKEVKDENGYNSGLMVSVNVRVNRVVNVSGLTERNFTRSNYTAETNTDRILKLATQGGYRGAYTDPEAEAVNLELGTPTQGYMQTWLPDAQNTYGSIYVPALFFPIIKNSAQNPYYGSSIVIPLVKEVLDTVEQNPMPMDIMEKQ